MVDPMDSHEFHIFREIVAQMTTDQKEGQLDMLNRVGKEVNAELAAQLARLDQRPLMTG